MTWKQVKRIALDRGMVIWGQFDGSPGKPDAASARRAFQVVRDLFPKLDGVMLVRDQDDQEERREGLDQARNAEVAFPVVVGLAVVERESWLICGFDPRDELEKSRLAEERQTLGFDPRHRSHELTACKDDQAKRSPKRVPSKLGGGDLDREAHCWRETPLTVLRERGAANGLSLFLTEIRERFAPLIGHVIEG